MTTIARFDMAQACYMLFTYRSYRNSDDFNTVDCIERSGSLYSYLPRSHGIIAILSQIRRVDVISSLIPDHEYSRGTVLHS